MDSSELSCYESIVSSYDGNTIDSIEDVEENIDEMDAFDGSLWFEFESGSSQFNPVIRESRRANGFEFEFAAGTPAYVNGSNTIQLII